MTSVYILLPQPTPSGKRELPVNRLHRLFRIPGPRGSSHGKRGIEPGELLGSQRDLQRSGVFLQSVYVLGSRNREDILPRLSSHARASWAGRHFFPAAISVRRSTRKRLRDRFSPVKRGELRL